MRHGGHSELLYQNPPLFIMVRIIIGVHPGVQSIIQPYYQVMAVIWIAAPGFLSNVSCTCTPQSDFGHLQLHTGKLNIQWNTGVTQNMSGRQKSSM